MPDPAQDNPPQDPSDKPDPSKTTDPGQVDKTPGNQGVDPIFHDPSKMDPALRPYAAQIERNMHAKFTKTMQGISGQTKILEQLEAAKSDPQRATMFARELMRLHGLDLPAQGSPQATDKAPSSTAIPDEALTDSESLGRHIDQRITDRADALMAERTSDLQSQRNSDQRQIRSLEGRLNKEAYPLYTKYEADIDQLRDRNPNLTTDQAYQLATAEERDFLTQQRYKAESDQKVSEAESTYTEEVDTSHGMADEDVSFKKGDSIEDIYNKLKPVPASS